MDAEAKITPEELEEMFGPPGLPIEAVNIIWNGDDSRTIGQIRAELRALAKRLKTKSLMTTQNEERLAKSVARSICKSRTCAGINCCQWPCNGGRYHDQNGQSTKCRVDEGRYDDAAREAILAYRNYVDDA